MAILKLYTYPDKVLSQKCEPVAEVTEDKEVVKDLGADSLDVMEMLMSLEEEYNITVAEDDAVNIKTVGDIINLINSAK